MPITSTTNLTGAIGSASSVATLVTLAPPAEILEVLILGSGSEMARIAKGRNNVTPTPNATTDNTIVQGTGYQPLVAEPMSGGITGLLLYANNGETDLTYSINLIKTGVVKLT